MTSLRPSVLLVASLSLSLAVAAPASAQNLLDNAGFDVGLSGWADPLPGLLAVWSPDDVGDHPRSGSVQVTNTPSHQGIGGGGPTQCVPVEGGVPYEFGAFVRLPAGQSRSGVAQVLVTYFTGGACDGAELGAAGATALEDVASGEWFPVQELFSDAPPGAASALVLLLVAKDEPGGTLTAWFDDVRFCPPGTCGFLHPDQDSLVIAGALGLTDFAFRLVIEGGETAVPGTEVDLCLAETLCAAGALPDRVEVQLRILGPRPNGFLWFQALRFTPSRVVIEAARYSTGTVHYYVLPAVRPGERPAGVEDRRAFLP